MKQVFGGQHVIAMDATGAAGAQLRAGEDNEAILKAGNVFLKEIKGEQHLLAAQHFNSGQFFNIGLAGVGIARMNPDDVFLALEVTAHEAGMTAFLHNFPHELGPFVGMVLRKSSTFM